MDNEWYDEIRERVLRLRWMVGDRLWRADGIMPSMGAFTIWISIETGEVS